MKKVIFSLLMVLGVLVCFTNCKKDKDPTYQDLIIGKWKSDSKNYGDINIKEGGKFSWDDSPWNSYYGGSSTDGKWELEGEELTLKPADYDKVKGEITKLTSKALEFEGKVNGYSKESYEFSKK